MDKERARERIRESVKRKRSEVVEALYWRKKSMGYIPSKELEDIYLQVAKEQIIKEVQNRSELWDQEGTNGLITIISEYAERMRTYANIAANRGIEEPFEVAYKYALAVLSTINKKYGGNTE